MQNDYGYFEEQKLGKAYDGRLLRRLLPFARPYLRLFGISVVLVVLVTLLDLALPLVTRQAIDRHIVPHLGSAAGGQGERRTLDLSDPRLRELVARHPGRFKLEGAQAHIALSDLKALPAPEQALLQQWDLSGVAAMTGLFILLVAAMFIVSFFQAQALEYAGQRIMHDLRLRLFDHLQGLSLSFFDRNPVGRLVTRTTNDIQNMNELFTSVVSFVFKDFFLLIGIAGVLLAMNWKLALISFAVLPLVAAASAYFSRRSREAFRTLQIKIAEINTRFAETIGGLRVIQLCGQETANAARFGELNHAYYRAGMDQVHVFAIFLPAIEVLAAAALAVVIYHGGHGVIDNRISLGSLVAFISYMRMFFRPIRDIAEKYNILQGAMASAERIFLILDSDERLAAAGATLDPREARHDITGLAFEDVRFAYVAGEPVLRGVSFAVGAGETVAIVGPTGSGKTSLVNLVLRARDPDSGCVRVSGHDLRRVDIGPLRRKMALVSQDPFLFSGSVRENILLGRGDLSEAQIERLLDLAQCRELVARLPRGLDTPLSEAGKSLSSGERQLISIARALARDPQLIILDEATSYIDAQTEARMQQALARLTAGRTTLLVAHRLSTARHADRIVVLHRGRVIEQGSHDALMQRQGFYHRLVRLQGGRRGE